MSAENFLSRWSRRKQQVREAEQPGPKAPPIETESPSPEPRLDAAMPEEVGEGAPAPEAELGPEEIAKLPSLDELTPETDISVFLRKGVPEPLRNAALRRMWSLDPAIRDFVSEAREYAYDWNTPGGVPGSGALPASEEIARMAARIVGAVEPGLSTGISQRPSREAALGSQNREQLSSAEAVSEPAALVAPQEQGGAASAQASAAVANQGDLAGPSCASGEERDAAFVAAPQQGEAKQSATPARPRRHGGAMPL